MDLVISGVNYGNCRMIVSRYFTKCNNIAMYFADDEEVVAVCTINLDIDKEEMRNDCVAIKNYSENEGMDKFLIEMGYIEKTPLYFVESGFVKIPIYKITDKTKKLM